MVQKLVIYPDPRINSTSTDVRQFNQTLWNVLEDMKDTMIEHDLKALSAIQIAYPYNIIIIKEGEEYVEYINPRELRSDDKFESTETTLYYPNTEVTITRYSKMKLVYENREGKPLHRDIEERELAVIMQRKIDYLFGGNFLDKVGKKRKDEILEALEKNGHIPAPVDDVCPTFSKKDYFVSFTDKILFFMGFSLLTPLFSFAPSTIANIFLFDKIALLLVIGLMAGFFLYAQVEAKKFGQCSSCQIGNNIGVIIKRVSVAIILAIGAYFLVNPN
jgi:peptide deformylase